MMKPLTIRNIFSTAIFASVCCVQAAAAANLSVVNYVFSGSNTPGFQSQDVGHLQIEQIGADTKWTLSADWNNQYNSSNPFVFGLDFATGNGIITNHSLSLTYLNGQVGLHSYGKNGLYFNPSNTTNRFTDGEAVRWVFHSTKIADFAVKGLHVNSIYNGNSVKFSPTTPVPEAETYAMLLLGLAGLGLRQRWRNAKP